MKNIMFYGLFLAALSSSAFAMDNKDLCAAHIQKIQDTVASPGNMAAQTINLTKQNLEKAKAAQAAGNSKQCLDITLQTLMKLRQYLN